MITVGRIRRADKPPGGNPSKVAPRCKARPSSTASASNATVSAVNAAAIKFGRVRRVGKPPGGASSGSGSEYSESSEGSEGSGSNAGSLREDSPPPPPLNAAVDLAPYTREGALAALYMRASDEAVTADLVAKGKLRTGVRIASQFTYVSAFKSSGWEEQDATADIRGGYFGWYVPFADALRSLGISDAARPEGKHEHLVFDHTLTWQHNGRPMQVSESSNSQ